jgi:hypothetical protein
LIVWTHSTQNKKKKKGNMSEEKKDKAKTNVRDLKPNKDAKGGGSSGSTLSTGNPPRSRPPQ